MHGNYFIIEGGDPAIALRDLTGAPVEILDNCEDLEVVWDFIHEAEKKSSFLYIVLISFRLYYYLLYKDRRNQRRIAISRDY